MPPFKDEHVLIIVPGSQTTLAQLGLPESFTPASHRFPTRVFPAPDGKTFEPYKIRSRNKEAVTNGGDVEMGGIAEPKTEGDDEELIELPEDDEGAIYPLKEGRIENMPAFFAFLEHIRNSLTSQLHTPIMLVAQPSWTAKNHEDITQFIFEKFKTPALCIMDSALVTSYAFGIPNATIIDVGFEKIDVTAVTEFMISGRGCVPQSGGEGMTQRLMMLLKNKDFTRDMAEQLKRSPICEVLPPGTPLPGTGDAPEEEISNPAAAASTGATASGPSVRITEPAPAAIVDTEVGEEDDLGDKIVEDDGVLDVARLVTSDNATELLAKIAEKRAKDKEDAEKAKADKANEKAARKLVRDQERAEAAAAAARPIRLPNSKRPRAVFHYEEIAKDAPDAKRQKTPEAAPTTAEEAPVEAAPATEVEPAPVEDEAAQREQQKAARKEERRKNRGDDRVRRDIEIGTERFLAADEGYLDAVADTIYRTILSVDDISKRQDAWDSLVICGSGSKVRGFKDALLTTLNNRYLVSPSSATMFMSELPSNLATPSGTGSQTPNASFAPHAPPTASAVNPLLLAATTASHPSLNPNISVASFNGTQQHHSSHSQSPTSIKVATPPSYFPEWKSYDEAVFLGSQVAAKVVFVVDQGLSKGFLSRVEFNEEGPTAIHQVGLVY